MHRGGEGCLERDLYFPIQRIKTLKYLCLKNVLVCFGADVAKGEEYCCLLYTSPSPRDH